MLYTNTFILSDFSTILTVRMLKFGFFLKCSSYHKAYAFYTFFSFQLKGVMWIHQYSQRNSLSTKGVSI